MNEYIVKNGKKLRLGFTTGSCAAAATKAAATMLLTKENIETAYVSLPRGDHIMLDICDSLLRDSYASCSVIKDAGDDPDVTDGMKIFSKVSLILDRAEIIIEGGPGVGRVTKPGLSVNVGEAAINPVPDKMIRKALVQVADKYNYRGGFKVEIYAPQGEEVAARTFNPRLGIEGGISILGTTGIVEPMSESAIIDTIKLEINSKNKEQILFLTPGNYGLDYARKNLELKIEDGIKCSNFIGESLDYASYKGYRRIFLIGHGGKLIKLAAGIMNTHSKMADGRKEICAAHAAVCGARLEVIEEIMEALTLDEMHLILEKASIKDKVYNSISEQIAFQLKQRVQGKVEIEYLVFSNAYGTLMKSKNASEYIEEIKEYYNEG